MKFGVIVFPGSNCDHDAFFAVSNNLGQKAEYIWHDGPAPQNGCTCGFYAWYAPTPRTASAGTSELVGGAVALWGRVELHAHGGAQPSAGSPSMLAPLCSAT